MAQFSAIFNKKTVFFRGWNPLLGLFRARDLCHTRKQHIDGKKGAKQ